MGKLLLLLFTVVPFIEIYLLMTVGSLVGFWPTVGIVLATGMLGAALAKHEGVRVLSRWQRDMSEGRVPADGVLDGVLILVGGVLLVTPGVLTDAVGLALLVPWTRRALSTLVRSRIEKGVASGKVRVVQGDQTQASPFGASPFSASPFGSASFGGPRAQSGGQKPIDLQELLHRARGGHIIEVEGEELTVDPPDELGS